MSTLLPTDPVLTEEEENAIIDRLIDLFPNVPLEEVAERVRRHNRSPHVRCRKYLSSLVQSELRGVRCQHQPKLSPPSPETPSER